MIRKTGHIVNRIPGSDDPLATVHLESSNRAVYPYTILKEDVDLLQEKLAHINLKQPPKTFLSDTADSSDSDDTLPSSPITPTRTPKLPGHLDLSEKRGLPIEKSKRVAHTSNVTGSRRLFTQAHEEGGRNTQVSETRKTPIKRRPEGHGGKTVSFDAPEVLGEGEGGVYGPATSARGILGEKLSRFLSMSAPGTEDETIKTISMVIRDLSPDPAMKDEILGLLAHYLTLKPGLSVNDVADHLEALCRQHHGLTLSTPGSQAEVPAPPVSSLSQNSGPPPGHTPNITSASSYAAFPSASSPMRPVSTPPIAQQLSPVWESYAQQPPQIFSHGQVFGALPPQNYQGFRIPPDPSIATQNGHHPSVGFPGYPQAQFQAYFASPSHPPQEAVSAPVVPGANLSYAHPVRETASAPVGLYPTDLKITRHSSSIQGTDNAAAMNTYYLSTSTQDISTPPPDANKRSSSDMPIKVGDIFIHNGKKKTAWLLTDQGWVDFTESYKADDGKTKHPKINRILTFKVDGKPTWVSEGWYKRSTRVPRNTTL